MDGVALWIVFNLGVLVMLAVDLGVFQRRGHTPSLREATAWSLVWVVLSLLFNYWILREHGSTPALEFFTGYLIEKALSADNLFVIAVLFRYFAVEPRYQHRVLYWGLLGALVMRGTMIGLGVVLIRRFAWVLYVFGAFLFYAGMRLLLHKGELVHPERNPIFRAVRRFMPLTASYEGQRFVVRCEGVWRATPLLLVLLVIETADLMFALDSIPAVFAVTRDAFIVYSSNVCAVLGLRAFFFLLASLLPYFRYLDMGLSVVLMFIGIKMLGQHWFKIPTHIALAVVAGVLFLAVLASFMMSKKGGAAERGLAVKKSAVSEQSPTEVSRG